jgi:hypothetical protein
MVFTPTKKIFSVFILIAIIFICCLIGLYFNSIGKAIIKELTYEKEQEKAALNLSPLIIEANRDKRFEEIEYNSEMVRMEKNLKERIIVFRYIADESGLGADYHYYLVYYEKGHGINNTEEEYVYKVYNQNWYLEKQPTN